MTRFVALEGRDGQIHHVNPDQVQTVTMSPNNIWARLVFNGVAGGVHELAVKLSPEDAVAALTGRAAAPKAKQTG